MTKQLSFYFLISYSEEFYKKDAIKKDVNMIFNFVFLQKLSKKLKKLYS